MLTTQVGVVLGIVTLIGGILAGFGYDLADRLLSYVGWLAGGAAGGLVGWFGAPLVATGVSSPRTEVAVGAVLVGGVVGRTFFPIATRLGMVVTGFLVSAGATLAVFVGGEVTRLFAAVSLSDPASVVTVVERVAALPVFSADVFTRSLLIAVVVGLVGAVFAARYYTLILTVAVTGLGSVLLGVVAPLWERALAGSVALGAGVSVLSPAVAVAVLVAGLGVQFYRHGDAAALPTLADDPL